MNLVTGEINKPLTLQQIMALNGQKVSVDGMISNIRSLSQVAFLLIQLYKGSIQGVLEGNSLELLNKVNKGDFITLHGKSIINGKAKGGVEIGIESIDIIGSGDTAEFQFSRAMKENLETLLDNRIITLRNVEQRAIFRLSDGISKGFRDFLHEEGFTEIHSPKIVSSGAEGGANVFELDYFGKKVCLAQSPQFYKQFMVPVFHRVFETSPVFRAEKHGTSRHLNEYTSFDVEMGPISSFRDIMSLETKLLRYLIQFLNENYGEELDILKVELPEIGKGIPEITFDQAKELISKIYKRPILDLEDIEPEEERLLSQIVKEKTGSDFVFVTNYPFGKRPFYTMPSSNKSGRTEGFDLLFRGLEITTGGQRIHNYEMQIDNIKKKGLNPDDFKDFLTLHKAGTIPHGGFGLGQERLLQKLLNRQNIRETTLFPRDLKRVVP